MSEGVRRVAVAVRWAGYAFAAVVFAVFALISMMETGPSAPLGVAIGGAFAAVIAGAGWGLAWVIEGFANR